MVWFVIALANGPSPAGGRWLVFGLMIVVLMGVFIFRAFRSVKEGYPIKDEMTKRLKTKAAAYAYFISLYVWLAVGAATTLIKGR